MKKLAVVCSGWHYPLHFYLQISSQQLPDDWDMDLFCVSHRDPWESGHEKSGHVFPGQRAHLDHILYGLDLVSVRLMPEPWIYEIYPNTIGDWGCSNQWLETHDYKEYDLLLFTHDDNLILLTTWFKEIIESEDFESWEILTNSCGAPPGWLRGSCEFFKPSLIEKIGGKFDLSKVTLQRVGITQGSLDISEINDWNNTVHPLMEFINRNQIGVKLGSPWYRVSKFCIEGERGYIHKTSYDNHISEDQGLIALNLIPSL
jgi:hypothetical protein